MGVDNFDNVQKIMDLQFTLKDCHTEMKKQLKTNSEEKCIQVLKQGMTREILAIQNRKLSRKYAEAHAKEKESNLDDIEIGQFLMQDSQMEEGLRSPTLQADKAEKKQTSKLDQPKASMISIKTEGSGHF